MIFLPIIKQNVAFSSKIQEGVELLKAANYFHAALELSQVKAEQISCPDPIQQAAMQRQFQRGYVEAINDLINFLQLYVVPKAEQVKANYGVINQLLSVGDITEEEAKHLRGK